MWFDPRAALAELRGADRPPATPATTATRRHHGPSCVAGVAEVAARPSPNAATLAEARDAYEERAAIREFDRGQARAEAERAALAETAQAYGFPTFTLDHLSRILRDDRK